MNLYLYFQENKFTRIIFRVGVSGLIGGAGLGVAMMSFIYSITNTSAAITLLCLAAMPFFTALLGFLFLRENFNKCLDSYYNCYYWYNNNCNRKYR